MIAVKKSSNRQSGSSDRDDRLCSQNRAENRPIILAIDDEETMLKLLRVNLSVDGYQIVTASNGKSALDLLEEYKPDLVILDVIMPGLNGFQILDLIRQRSNVPVIIITARWEMITEYDNVGLGADDHLRKPFSILELMARVRARLGYTGQRESQVAH